MLLYFDFAISRHITCFSCYNFAHCLLHLPAGKRLRPTMLLLMASSLTNFVPNPSAFTIDNRPPGVHPQEARRQQQRIAEISELIHVASLLHDDVIDDAETRRGLKALNLVFGNKVAILAGICLLAIPSWLTFVSLF